MRQTSISLSKREAHEIETRITNDARQRGRRARPTHCVVQGVRSPGRARPCRVGPAVWHRDQRSRLARAARVLELWEQSGRYGDYRHRAAVALLPARPAGARRSARVSFLGSWWSRRRRLGWRSRKLRPNAAQRPDTRRQRVAIVFDDVVEFPKERRCFLIRQIYRHGATGRRCCVPIYPSPAPRRRSATACSESRRARRTPKGRRDPGHDGSQDSMLLLPPEQRAPGE